MHLNPKLGNVIKHRRRPKTIGQIFQIEIKQFCSDTALHGYKFIMLPKRSLIERVIWALICLTSLATALALLCVAWFSFQQNPTVLVTDSTHYSIWNYPFPAVTICNYNIISKSRALKLAQSFSVKNGRTPEEIAWDFRVLFQLVNHNNPNIPEDNYTRVYNLLRDNNISVSTALQEMAPSCNDMLIRCKWKGEIKRCNTLFELVRTTMGFCCSFNYYALKNHTIKGVPLSKVPKQPRRVSACGHQTALEVLIDANQSDYFATYIPSFGFRIFVHDSYILPSWNLQNIFMRIQSLRLVYVTPMITYSTDNIKRMPPQARECLLPNERAHRNFDRYNFHNCMLECKINLTLRLCGCKPFYYVFGKDDDENVCSLRNISCLSENEALLTSGFSFKSVNEDHKYGLEKSWCDCLPDCESTGYISEYSSGDLNINYLSNETTIFSGITVNNQSLLKVYFNDLVGIRNRRDVIFTWHTLLAYYGGILGLFTGFSFVSGMEIIYFFIIRVLGDISRNNKTIKKQKTSMRRHKSIINIQPITYENLDPRLLTFPFNKGMNNKNIHSYLH